MLVHCWSAVYDVGPTVNQHWVNVSCLLGLGQYIVKQTRDARSTLPQYWANFDYIESTLDLTLFWDVITGHIN